MNWYSKLVKVSGVDDFSSGVIKHKIATEYPEKEEDLSYEQKSKLREIGWSNSIPLLDKAEYFRKYPNIIYFPLYDLRNYIAWKYSPGMWNDDIEQLMMLIKNNDSPKSIADGFNEKFYQIVMKDYNKWGVDSKTAAEIFRYSKGYPQFFIDDMKKRFNNIYLASMPQKTIEQNLIYLQKFLSFPSDENLSLLTAAVFSLNPIIEGNVSAYYSKNPQVIEKRKSFSKSAYLALINFEKTQNSSRKILNRKKSSSYSSSGKGKEIALKAYSALEKLYSGENFEQEDNPFSIFIDSSDKTIGTVQNLYFDNYFIQSDSLEQIYKICSKNPNGYYSIEAGQEENSGNLLLVDDDQDPKSITVVGKFNQMDILGDSPIETANTVVALNIKDKSEVYLDWFNKKLNEEKIKKQENMFFLELFDSDLFADILNKASDSFGSIKINNSTMIHESEYDENKMYSYREVLPFAIKTADAIMDQIPANIKFQIPENKIGTWYYLCSGKMPCNMVLDRALKHPVDTMKIIDSVSCINGQSGANTKIQNQVRDQVEKKKVESTGIFKSKIKEFLSDINNCRIMKITDFPELAQYSKDMIDHHIDKTSRGWSESQQKSIPMNQFVMERVERTFIYIIDKNKFISFFGEEELEAVGYSPNNAKGFFSKQYGFSDEHDSIVVFTGDSMSRNEVAKIAEDLLGLKPEPGSSLTSITEEGTLWHEVAHSFLSTIVPHEQISGESAWMKSPSELMALQYGNLQLMKRRLHQFFENQIPISAKIEAGLLSHIETEIIETFSWEFNGMPKEKALEMVRQNMEDFKEQISESRSSMSKEEVVNFLTNMFLEFFMGKLLRNVVEDDMDKITKMMNQDKDKKMYFKEEETVVPDNYEYLQQGQKDKDIINLESRPDYKQFIASCKNFLQQYISNPRTDKNEIKRFVHRTDKTIFKEPRILTDLISLIFDPPSSLLDVDITRLNRFFGDLVPSSLKNDVITLIENKRKLLSVPIPENRDPVTPDEAEETGKFMVQQDQEYGKDWMWTAKSKNWYKIADDVLKIK